MNDIEREIIALYEQIYELRKNCGIKRQEIHSNDVESLDQNLRESLQKTEPYTLAFSQKKSLEDLVETYRKGGNGRSAKVAPEGYLYRIANPVDVFVNIQSNDFPEEEIFTLSMELWNKLNDLSDEGMKWIQLSEYGDKPYSTSSEISWWTRHELDDSDTSVIEKATRLGLFVNWVNNQTYLLRCKAGICVESPIASVPTIVDAYASGVFYTTENAKNPIEGTTINLSQAPELNLGISEVVLKKIDLNCIEIKPVEIKSEECQSSSHITSKSPEILKSLISYYENMP